MLAFTTLFCILCVFQPAEGDRRRRRRKFKRQRLCEPPKNQGKKKEKNNTMSHPLGPSFIISPRWLEGARHTSLICRGEWQGNTMGNSPSKRIKRAAKKEKKVLSFHGQKIKKLPDNINTCTQLEELGRNSL